MTMAVGAGPRNAWSDPRTGLRMYTWRGQQLPSVTSLRRMAGMPHGLHQWALSRVIDRAVLSHDELTAMLTRDPRPRERVVDKNRVAEASKWLRAAATDERDASAALGTAVHDAAAAGLRPEDVPDVVELHRDGKTTLVDGAEIRPRLAQYRDWLEHSGAQVIASEFQCWNLSLGYAGSADLLARIDGTTFLVDIKTGGAIYPEHLLQVMAYALAEFVGADDVVDEALTQELEQVVCVAVLHIAADHWEFRRLRHDDAAWRAFRGLLAFATWMQAHPNADAVTWPVVVCFVCRKDITGETPTWTSPITGAPAGSTTMPHHAACARTAA